MNPIASFHQQLHRWYAKHGRRDLPWRTTSDAYAIYLSEIMLQQTQVKTVLERFYHPFLRRFPTLSALAAAEQAEVLQAWQGLGYYNRAINLQKAAQRCAGQLPDTIEALMALPGIGQNTAHAVASFAFRQPVAVMEANVKRVLSRLFAMTHPTDAELWRHADTLLDRANPFDHNQAMMDIGSLICTRRAPKCVECPASTICQGKSSPESYPAAKAKKQVPVRRKRIIVLYNEKGQVYATARKTRFLQGLYHFLEAAPDVSHIQLAGQDYALSGAERLGEVRQQYSHFTLEADIWRLQVAKTGRDWYGGNALRSLPMSMAEQKILALLPEEEIA